MISVLITAWKEERTIKKCIECIVNQNYSGIPENFELILACPDEETLSSAKKIIEKYKIQEKFKHIQDPAKGKNYALNLLMENAKGDIWILTDGDVYFGENCIKNLLEKMEKGKYDLVSTRPKSAQTKNNMMSYFGNLLADAAHHKRMISLEKVVSRSSKFVSQEPFFPVSGYGYAIRKTKLRFPIDCLADDAYISYASFKEGKKIGYAPNAIVYVNYPTNLKDYFIQKKRSAGAYVQLWKYNILTKNTVTRSFKKELQYFWFPIKYASNLKELMWSLALYPIRLLQWIVIFYEQKILRKNLMKNGSWERVESTK